MFYFGTAYSKTAQTVGILSNTNMETISPCTNSSINNVLLQSNPDFISHFLNS